RGRSRLVRRAPPRRDGLSDTGDPSASPPGRQASDATTRAPICDRRLQCDEARGSGRVGGEGQDQWEGQDGSEGQDGWEGQDRTSEGSSRYRRLSSSCRASITWSTSFRAWDTSYSSPTSRSTAAARRSSSSAPGAEISAAAANRSTLP